MNMNFRSKIIKDPVHFSLSHSLLFGEETRPGKNDILRPLTLIKMFNSTAWHDGLRVVQINNYGLSCEMPREAFKALFKLSETEVEEMQELGYSGKLEFGEHMSPHIDHIDVYPPITYL